MWCLKVFYLPLCIIPSSQKTLNVNRHLAAHHTTVGWVNHLVSVYIPSIILLVYLYSHYVHTLSSILLQWSHPVHTPSSILLQWRHYVHIPSFILYLYSNSVESFRLHMYTFLYHNLWSHSVHKPFFILILLYLPHSWDSLVKLLDERPLLVNICLTLSFHWWFSIFAYFNKIVRSTLY